MSANGGRNGWVPVTARYALRLLITFNVAWSIEDYLHGRFPDSKAELALAVAFTALYFVLDIKTRGQQAVPASDQEEPRR